MCTWRPSTGPRWPGRRHPRRGWSTTLRDDGDVVRALSLVAEHDGEVVGHVVCSRARIGERPSLGLGPIGIRPDRQRTGIGTALMHAVIGGAEALDEPTIVLLGHPDFYPRFGFEPAVDHGITPPADWSRQHFMVRRLTAWSPAERGPFHYAAAFSRV